MVYPARHDPKKSNVYPHLRPGTVEENRKINVHMHPRPAQICRNPTRSRIFVDLSDHRCAVAGSSVRLRMNTKTAPLQPPIPLSLLGSSPVTS